MASFSGLGLGLSFLFGFVLLTLVGAELYYLLWWKKRSPRGDIEEETDCTIETTHEFPYLFFWKKPNSIHSTNSETQQSITNSATKNSDPSEQPDLELQKKGFVEEEGIESELMRLHNLCGPPRFLFTIKEETREDLESEDGKSRNRSRKGSRSKSLSDLLHGVDMTPMASPLKSQSHPLESFNHHGFNPLFESSNDSELSKLGSSPPPKFKFLRDAEEKLMRKLMDEAERRGLKNGGSVQDFAIEDRDGSFIRIIVGKSREQVQQCPPSTASQVLPLASSPKAFRSLDSNSKPIKL